jgi:hypothetical protein
MEWTPYEVEFQHDDNPYRDNDEKVEVYDDNPYIDSDEKVEWRIYE